MPVLVLLILFFSIVKIHMQQVMYKCFSLPGTLGCLKTVCIVLEMRQISSLLLVGSLQVSPEEVNAKAKISNPPPKKKKVCGRKKFDKATSFVKDDGRD